MFRFIMAPSNWVCDICGMKDEGERSAMRMLVNGLIGTFFGVWAVYVFS